MDDKGVPVATLAPDDLKVAENGVEGKIVKVEPIDWPVKVQLLVDNGAGMDAALVQIRNGVKGFVEALPDGIEMSLLHDRPAAPVIVRPTTDKQAMVQGADRIAPDSGAAAVHRSADRGRGAHRQGKGQLLPGRRDPRLDDRPKAARSCERDVQRMLQRFVDRGRTVHVVMLVDRRAVRPVAARNQTAVGDAVAKNTGGRYETIAAATGWPRCCPRSAPRLPRATSVRAINTGLRFSGRTARPAPLGQIGAADPAPG